jgi:signal peptidase II
LRALLARGLRTGGVSTSPSKWAVLALLAGAIFVGDQISKYLAVEHLTTAFESVNARTTAEKVQAFIHERDLQERGLALPPKRVVDSVWQWRYTQNRGAAWGLGANQAEKFRVPFFHLVTIAAVIFIISYFRNLDSSQRYLQVALALLLGGALGNGVDRLLRGYVIDFIDWHWFDPGWTNPGRHWPTFNVADSGVSIGLVMLILDWVRTSAWWRGLAVKKESAQAGIPDEKRPGPRLP